MTDTVNVEIFSVELALITCNCCGVRFVLIGITDEYQWIQTKVNYCPVCGEKQINE